MNTRTVVCWISAALLIASTSLAAGCVSDPSDSEFNENGSDAGGPDAGDPDAGDTDTGDTDAPDGGDPDADADLDDADTDPGPDPDDCIVPGDGNTLTDALEAGCGPVGNEVKLDDDVDVDALGADGESVEIDGQVIIEPDEDYDGSGPFIDAPDYGLFDVNGDDAELELRNLDITGDDANTDEVGEALISVTGGATLTTYDVRIRDIAPLMSTIISAVDAEEITLEATDIRDHGPAFDGPSAIDCKNTEITLTGDSTITNSGAQSDNVENPDFLSVVALDDCTLNVDDSSITGNHFDLHTAEADATAVDCNDSHIDLVNADISNNHVEATIDVLDEKKLSLHGAGLHLDACSLDATASTIDANRLALIVEDFDHDAEDEFDIALRGAGVYATDSDITLGDGSVVSGNEVLSGSTDEGDVGIENDGDQIDLHLISTGAGLALNQTDLTITQSTVDENSIHVAVTGAVLASTSNPDFGIYSTGAGAAFSSSDDHTFTVEQSTFSNNTIQSHDDTYVSGLRSTDDTGAGISFSTTADAQFQMENSTIMQNSITGGDSARAAGIFVQAPSIPEFEDEGSGIPIIGNILDALGEWLDDEGIPLTSVIRYSTIAQNTIDTAEPAGVGYYVGIHPDADDEDEGPFISSIGLLLNANDDENANQLYDCDGTATTATPDGDQDEFIEGEFNWMSAHNVHDTTLSHQDECSALLGGAGTAPIAFSSDSGGTTTVLLPDPQSQSIDFGEETPHCSGIYVGEDHELEYDQRGVEFDRAVNGACDIGAVELQENERE